MKKLKSNKAFTLIEMIISLGITTILVTAVMFMFRPVQGIINSLDENMTVNTTIDTVTVYMANKLVKCQTYNIGLFTESQLTADISDTDGAPYRANNIIPDGSEANVKTYCMLIDFTASGYYRFYDLGHISDVDDYKDKIANKQKYALFDDAYYNDINYKFTFKTTSDPSSAEYKKWCRIGAIAFDENNEPIAAERSQTFKLINMAFNGGISPSSDTELEKFDYSDDNIVIFYNIKQYTA